MNKQILMSLHSTLEIMCDMPDNSKLEEANVISQNTENVMLQ